MRRFYYKIRQGLQKVAGISKCIDYYKTGHNTEYISDVTYEIIKISRRLQSYKKCRKLTNVYFGSKEKYAIYENTDKYRP